MSATYGLGLLRLIPDSDSLSIDERIELIRQLSSRKFVHSLYELIDDKLFRFVGNEVTEVTNVKLKKARELWINKSYGGSMSYDAWTCIGADIILPTTSSPRFRDMTRVRIGREEFTVKYYPYMSIFGIQQDESLKHLHDELNSFAQYNAGNELSVAIVIS